LILCQNCGRQNEDHYRFCLGCGTPLAAMKRPQPAAPGPASGAGPEVASKPGEKSSWSLGAAKPSPLPGASASDRRPRPGGAAALKLTEETAGPDVQAPVPLTAARESGGSAPRGTPAGKEVAFAPTAAAMPALTSAPARPAGEPDVATSVGAASAPPLPGTAVGPVPGSPAGPLHLGAVSPSIPSSPSPSVPAFDHARKGAERVCSTCGAEVPEVFSFCGRCGARLSESPAKTMYLSGGPAVPETRALGRLVALRADGSAGEAVPLHDGENVLGRETSVAFLAADRLLSPRHATFFFRAGRLFVRDDGSLNGVFLKIREEREISSGDVFRIGQQLLRYDDFRDVEVLVPPPPGDDSFVLGSPDPGYWGRLVQVVARDRVGNIFLLAGNEVTLGRERAQITFPFDGFVSGTHAALLRRGERVILVDRGSSNGTYVRMTGETPLQYGDLLLVGQNLLRVELFG
jgi:pSer/pThr/pTyr-binding forkhead associated (FHA) protein